MLSGGVKVINYAIKKMISHFIFKAVLNCVIPFILAFRASQFRTKKLNKEHKLDGGQKPHVRGRWNSKLAPNTKVKIIAWPGGDGRWKYTRAVSVLSSVCMAYSTLSSSKKKEKNRWHKCLCEIRTGYGLSGPLRRLEISKMCTDSASSASARLSTLDPTTTARAAPTWALQTMSGKAI